MTNPGPQSIPAERLHAFEGRPAGPAMEAPDPVNQAMIRHWVEAMGDHNPVYVDEEAARAAGFPGVVAPATMLQAWTMRGYRKSMEAERMRGGVDQPASALEELFGLLDEAGFTSVVATDCEQDYCRPLVLGDRLRAESVIESVSPQKRTALGEGHFVTTRTDYVAVGGDDGADSEPVATMRFRILRFRPSKVTEPLASVAAPSDPPPPRRPRPAITADNAFFFEGARRGVLLVQECRNCGRLRHPPGPSCPRCRSLDWRPVESSGRGHVFSYVVVHHPQVPAFDYPLVIALVEMEEGTRLVADVTGVTPGEVVIGMPVVAEMVEVDDELTIPMFRPAGIPSGDGSG